MKGFDPKFKDLQDYVGATSHNLLVNQQNHQVQYFQALHLDL